MRKKYMYNIIHVVKNFKNVYMRKKYMYTCNIINVVKNFKKVKVGISETSLTFYNQKISFF